MAGAFVTGSDAPEKTAIKVGFMPLTDCASLVMASVLGLDEKYGIKLVLERQHSWSGMRDRLLKGELDAAHVLYGLLYGVEMGIGCTATPMAVLMNLSRNGQAITLARADFVDANPHACRALVAAVLEAGRWIDASHAHREAAAEVLASPAWVGAERGEIAPRLHGEYDDGLGRRWVDAHPLRFHQDGE